MLDEAAAAGIEDSALPAVVDHLRALSEEHAQQQSERRTNAELALQMIDLLRKAGQTEKIAAQLAVHGFASIEEVEEAAGVHPAPPSATTDVPESDTATVDEPEPAAHEEETLPVRADQEADVAPPTSLSAPPADGPPTPAAEDAETATEPAAPEQKATAPAAPAPLAADVSSAAPEVATTPSSAAAPQSRPPVNESPATPAVEKPLESTSSLDEWPWDEGDPPIIGRLLLEGREALAYHTAVAAAETEHRRQLLLFSCAAAHCAPEAIE
ncbi:MAG: hypothetical protein O3B27_10585, partial [Actinomycetota bacterium]|nr:hypothetical protein [Actinomycetota bacterium]